MRSRLVILAMALVALSGAARAQDASVVRVAYDYTAMYRNLNPSVVKVYADAASGSGFLVDRAGFIATNHHVVANARYLAVQFADGRKVTAELVVLSPRYDLAILKVNSSLVSSLAPLKLLPAERDATVTSGLPVLAFGNPLSQTQMMTQGIVSKVEENSLVGDFLIDHGNSGGPLVNLDGEVVGINTFGLHNIAGAVRVTLLRNLLPHAIEIAGTDEPSSASLPTLDPRRYPPEVLKSKILSEPLDKEVYRFDGGKFIVAVHTPVEIGKTQIQEDLMQASNRYQRRGKKIKDPTYLPIDEPYYDWYRDIARELDYAVTFEIAPDLGTTTGSKWALGLAALAGGAKAVENTHVNMEFKAEFDSFKLYRDGVLVEPVLPGRMITDMAFSNAHATFIDEAYAGWYQYRPEEFLTGSEFRLEIYDAREPGKIHKTINIKSDSKLIRALRSDFAGVDR